MEPVFHKIKIVCALCMEMHRVCNENKTLYLVHDKKKDGMVCF